MILNSLQAKIQEAMKAADSVKVSTYQMLLASLKNAEIKKRPDSLTEEDELKVVQSEIKKRRDSIEAFRKAGRLQSAQKEEAEQRLLEEFLPNQLSDDDLAKLINEAIEKTGATEMMDIGKVISIVMAQAGNSVEGGRVSQMAKEKLAS